MLDERHDGLTRAVAVAGRGRGGCRRTRQPDGAGCSDPCRSEKLPSAGVTHLVLHIGTRTSSVTYATGVSAPGGFRIGPVLFADCSWRLGAVGVASRPCVRRPRTPSASSPLSPPPCSAPAWRRPGRRPRSADPGVPAGRGESDRQGRPLRDVQRLAEPQRRGPAGHRPVDAEQRPGVADRRDHPAGQPRRPADQRVRLRRRRPGRRAVPRQLPRGAAQRRAGRGLPLLLRRAVQHRHAERLRPRTTTGSWAVADDAFGFGFFPGQFGMAVFSKYPIKYDDVRTFQHFLWKDMPGALLPDDPTTPPRGLVLARRARRLPALEQVPLGRPDQHRHEDRALPGLPPDPAGVRRTPRTATARATTTRSGSGPTTSPAAPRRRTSTTTTGGTGGLARGARFVIAGDQNSDPLDGDSIPGSTQQLLDNPRINASSPPDQRRRRRGDRAAGRREPDPRVAAAVRHRRLRRQRTRQPAGRLRAAEPTAGDPRLGRVLAGARRPVVPADLVFPAQPTDHRMVWVDVHLNHQGA